MQLSARDVENEIRVGLLDGRPRLREFVAAFETVGAACRIERLRPTAELARRLRRAHDGWAAGGATFSLYSVVRI